MSMSASVKAARRVRLKQEFMEALVIYFVMGGLSLAAWWALPWLMLKLASSQPLPDWAFAVEVVCSRLLLLAVFIWGYHLMVAVLGYWMARANPIAHLISKISRPS